MQYLLHQSVEISASRHPDRPAFRFLDQDITYAELDIVSTQTANALAANGVRRGDRVGIYLNKSLECAIAIYGILKAGAAYVPLDPGAPPTRIDAIIRQCGIRCLLTHEPKQREVSRLIAELRPPLACIIGLSTELDTDIGQLSWDQVRKLPPLAPSGIGRTERDLAYIMYTSGSTGEPKGMMHTHSSGLSYARMAANLYGVSHQDRLGNHSPLHFDMSTFDYFSGPLAGACTVIIPEAYTKLPASLSELIQNERLTFWYSVPYALIQLLHQGALADRDLSSLRHVMFGGEPFPSKYLSALMKLLPQAQFCNVYGPAEVNQCTYFFVPPDWPADNPSTPIGRVWSNTEGLVVDGHDNTRPPGEVGELLIRSPTMMRGYWERPDLNSIAFFERQVTTDVSDRFYRTGDLVVENPDGELTFLGRKDRQIKIRGFRIELDEVESALASHPAVEEAAVHVPVGGDDSPFIQASVTLKQTQICSAEALKKYAAEQLPAYAVPATLDVLESFPRTGSGKIDRKALCEQAAVKGNNQVSAT